MSLPNTACGYDIMTVWTSLVLDCVVFRSLVCAFWLRVGLKEPSSYAQQEGSIQLSATSTVKSVAATGCNLGVMIYMDCNCAGLGFHHRQVEEGPTVSG